MWTLRQSGRFKSDLKRYFNQPGKMRALKAVLESLSSSGTVPAQNRPHALKEKIVSAQVVFDLLGD